MDSTPPDRECAIEPVECLKMRPKKSILKNRLSSLDADVKDSQDDSNNKAHFDEMNIIATFHPLDKDYGHMKIDEPPTPYNEPADVSDEGPGPSSSASAQNQPRAQRRVSLVSLERAFDATSSAAFQRTIPLSFEDTDEEELSEEEKIRRRKFNEKRKLHYVKEGAPLENHSFSLADETDGPSSSTDKYQK